MPDRCLFGVGKVEPTEWCPKAAGHGFTGAFCTEHAGRLAEIRKLARLPTGRRAASEIFKLRVEANESAAAEDEALIEDAIAKPKKQRQRCRLDGCDAWARHGILVCYRHRSVDPAVTKAPPLPRRCDVPGGCPNAAKGTYGRCALHPLRQFPRD